jgi:hypothetical protein
MEDIAIVKAANLLGLCFNMLGVTLLFFWSPPQPHPDAGTGRIVEDGTKMGDGRTAGEHRAEALRDRKRAKRIAVEALLLLFVGFALQLYAAL